MFAEFSFPKRFQRFTYIIIYTIKFYRANITKTLRTSARIFIYFFAADYFSQIIIIIMFYLRYLLDIHEPLPFIVSIQFANSK